MLPWPPISTRPTRPTTEEPCIVGTVDQEAIREAKERALAQALRERDEARAEVERLRPIVEDVARLRVGPVQGSALDQVMARARAALRPAGTLASRGET